MQIPDGLIERLYRFLLTLENSQGLAQELAEFIDNQDLTEVEKLGKTAARTGEHADLHKYLVARRDK